MRFKSIAAIGLLAAWLGGSYADEHEEKAEVIQHAPANYAGCGDPCGGCGSSCYIECLKPWTCEDLIMKPAEQTNLCTGCGWFHNLLWCDDGCTGCDEAAEEKSEEGTVELPTPLMGLIECHTPWLYEHLYCNKTSVTGWIQSGFTANMDSPTSRDNFGVNFNNRSNDFMINQVWIRIQKPLEHNGLVNWGYTVDFFGGQDAPDIANISLGSPFDNFTGDEGAAAPDTDYGLSLPQAFIEVHVPGLLFAKGMDFRFGRAFTIHGIEPFDAPSTRFYSRSYAFFYSEPFTHTGGWATAHVTDTIDVTGGIVLGWDVVTDDNNDSLSYQGAINWTSCDDRMSAGVATTIGPEGLTNDEWRYFVSYYFSKKFGCYDEWEVVLGGENAWDEAGANSEWYSYAANVFYTIDPRLILGMRAEYFSDEDGVRTGLPDAYYGLTMGATYKPYQNVMIRPEIRFDWADSGTPFNDGTEDFQLTAGFDVIYKF